MIGKVFGSIVFFFFQAEDGIRDLTVTGVQTCALPICGRRLELVEERRKGNCTERVLQATAASYVISPTALSAVAPDPSHEPDQRSARWLLAVAGRLVREVGELITGASAAGKPVATLGIDSEVRFASAKDRAAFAGELADAGNDLVAKYHDEAVPGGRPHRFVVALHPTITKNKEPQS